MEPAIVASLVRGSAIMLGIDWSNASRIGVFGIMEDVVHRPAFDDSTQIHDHHVIGHLRNHAHVVRDENDGQVFLLLQLAHQVEYLRLCRDIQGRTRFVGDQDAWVAGSAMAIITRWRRPPLS